MTTNIEDMAELPEALGDRFPVAIRINQPHPDAIALLSRDLRTIAVQLADAGEQRISLRKFMAFDKLREKLGDEQSAKIIFTDRASSILDAMISEFNLMSKKVKQIAEPNFITRRDREMGRWTVEECAPKRGEAYTDPIGRRVVAPIGTSELDRLIRAHELNACQDFSSR